jgi:hypothetical protein
MFAKTRRPRDGGQQVIARRVMIAVSMVAASAILVSCSYAASQFAYRAQLGRLTPSTDLAASKDRYEPDDTTATAHTLTPGAAPEDHTLYPASDVDCFTLEATATPYMVAIVSRGGYRVEGEGAGTNVEGVFGAGGKGVEWFTFGGRDSAKRGQVDIRVFSVRPDQLPLTYRIEYVRSFWPQ